MKKLLLITIILIALNPAHAFASTRYWIGGTNNWSNTGSWSASSGGVTDNTLPTSADDVHFDAGSNTSNAAYTVTVDVTANTRDLMFDAKPGDGLGGTITWAGSSAMNIFGSSLFLSGMTVTYTGAITYSATSTAKTITSNSVHLLSTVTWNGVGGGWQLQDAFYTSANGVSLTAGALDLNGKAFSNVGGQFDTGVGSATRSLTTGSSTITVGYFNSPGNAWLWRGTNVTYTAPGTETINIAGGHFAGGSLTYGTVVFTPSASSVALGSTFDGTNTFGTLTISGQTTKTGFVLLSANQTVTGTFTATGNSATNRLLIQSDTLGTPRTITAAAVSLTNVDFMDITFANSTSPGTHFTGTSLGDALGNSGDIDFTASVPQYWKTTTTGTKTWSTAGNWFLGTNGTGGAGRVPLPQDDVVFDASSIGAASTIISADMPRLGKSIDFTGVANSPTWTASADFSLYGSLTLTSTVTPPIAVRYLLYGRGTHTITTAGRFLNQIRILAYGGTYSLQDALSAFSLNVLNGTFTTNDFNISTNSGGTLGVSTASTINLGASIWTLTGSNAQSDTLFCWHTGTGLTLNPGTSTIKFTDATAVNKTFASNGKTYNNVWFSGAGTGNFIFTGNNTFNDFKADTPPHTIIFTHGMTQTVNTWHVSGQAPDGNTVKFGQLFGVVNNDFSTSAIATPAGNVFDLRAGILAADWNTEKQLLSANSSAAKFRWLFELAGANQVRLRWSTDGLTYVTPAMGTITLPVNTLGYVRAVLTLNNGAGGYTLQYYQSTDGTSWTQLGSDIIGGATTSIFSTSDSMEVGGRGGAGMWTGKVYRAQLYVDSVLTVDFNPNNQVAGNATWTASTGETWTTRGNAIVAATNQMALTSDTTATWAVVKAGGGQVYADYLNIWHSVATPVNTWYAGVHSTNNQSVTSAGSGWNFTLVPLFPFTTRAKTQFQGGFVRFLGGIFHFQ